MSGQNEDGGSRMADLASFIRDKNMIWYGPHPCDGCSAAVIKTGNGAEILTLDAADHNHHYPNFTWLKHECRNLRCSFGALTDKRCEKRAEWVSTFNGEVTGAGWCTDHVPMASHATPPGHGVRAIRKARTGDNGR